MRQDTVQVVSILFKDVCIHENTMGAPKDDYNPLKEGFFSESAKIKTKINIDSSGFNEIVDKLVYPAEIKMSVAADKNGKGSPYTIDVTAIGTFLITLIGDEITDKESIIEKTRYIIFIAVRDYVHFITSRMVYGGFIIPLQKFD